MPFIGWLGVLPPLSQVLSAASVPVASLLFKRTGQQFFLADVEDAGRLPGGWAAVECGAGACPVLMQCVKVRACDHAQRVHPVAEGGVTVPELV